MACRLLGAKPSFEPILYRNCTIDYNVDFLMGYYTSFVINDIVIMALKYNLI